MTGTTLTIAEAEHLVASALERCDTSPANAAIVARALVAAEADGLKGTGSRGRRATRPRRASARSTGMPSLTLSA